MECKNCKVALSDQDDYCKSCGAKVIRNRLTIKNLFEHFSEQFLNYDNKFFQTFLNLIIKPGDVIGSYINGTRKKYVNVISYFAIAITISGLQIFVLTKYFPEILSGEGLGQPGTEEFNKRNLDFTFEYQSILMMLYVPIYAGMSRLVFLKNKRYNYTEHIVIFMYVLAQLSILNALLVVPSALLGIDFMVISLILLPIQIIYSAFVLKQLYELDLGEILLKTLLFFLVLFVVGIIVMSFMIYFMIKDGTMQQIIEAQKAAKGISYMVSSAINWTS